MLSLSAESSKTDIDLQIVNGDGTGTSGVAYSAELMQFAEAVAGRQPNEIAIARDALLHAAGNDVVVDRISIDHWLQTLRFDCFAC